MYEFSRIEKKWQTFWKNDRTFESKVDNKKKKNYILVEFPYPSGAGLHVGHVRSYAALDAVARYRRMKGDNVLFPMGWDAFGLPAEQYAIKNHIHPKDAVRENIKFFKKQIQNLGISFDWSREINTTDPEYYKWTQWQFLKFYEHGLAYKDKKNINWCPNCKIGLSNEEASGGVCERCGSSVVQKEKEQWMLKMSLYAEDLLKGLKDTEFQEKIKTAQMNWIGKSVGAEVDFPIGHSSEKLTVFTTRPDTLFGVTFMVIAPEHPIIQLLKEKIENIEEVYNYQKKSMEKTAFERTELVKEKTGVRVKGIYANHPITNEKIEIWIADYVMMDYGTGAIMAVPAHDNRDFEFARNFNIEIKPVIASSINQQEELTSAYIEDGVHIHSQFLDGLNKEKAISTMIDYLVENQIGRKKVNYRLQDWVFSRQRFWGEPIPMIHCDVCGWVPVKEEELPVLLPDVAKYEPTDTGESPLAAIEEFVHTVCPKCGRDAKRETDTMPNWAGSSWYFLRYMDPYNQDQFVSEDALDYYGKVDLYNGGMEHATRHLLYARFWNQFLYNIHLVPNKEPFETRIAHGMILGSNGEKMSKSKGNVINPNDIVKEFGADTLRVYEMFIGDYEKEASWSTNGLKGCKRFLDRIWKLQEKINDKEGYTHESTVHKTIKKVTNDYENRKYNTVVSALMILLNDYDEMESITRDDFHIILHLLNPIAPHITEELEERCISKVPICKQSWPSYDEYKTIDQVYEMVVQVNGKVRGKISVSTDTDEQQMKKLAKEIENVKKFLEGRTIIKEIVIKGKLVNLVVK